MFSSQRRIDPAPASTHPKECTQCGCSSTSNALLECRNRRCATSADGAASQTRASNPEGLRAASRPRCWERDTKRLPIGKPSVSHAVLLPWRRSGKRLRRELCVVRAGVVAQSWRRAELETPEQVRCPRPMPPRTRQPRAVSWPQLKHKASRAEGDASQPCGRTCAAASHTFRSNDLCVQSICTLFKEESENQQK